MADIKQKKSVKTSEPKTHTNGAQKSVPLSDSVRNEILRDYRIASQSRQASLLGRKEVLTGKAKFGIFGDGKEVAQIAMAKVFRKGDFRSGYYRDQTFMFALGMSNIQEFFAQLYAHTDVVAEPSSAGRSMNGHYSTRSLNPDGSWKNLTEMYNSSVDVSPTGAQMPRLVGLAYASRLYRELEPLHQFTQFSHNGDEIAFGTIGNASCAEGMFWEALNAVGVLHAPVIMSIWDDGYGISVTNDLEMIKSSVSEALEGFRRKPGSKDGFDIYVVKGWDYPALIETYRKAEEITRREHVPAIIHVTEVTQPQGHSTSGSHERYKSPERLAWEHEFDCNKKMREWIIAQGIATEKELDEFEKEDIKLVNDWKNAAWKAYQTPVKNDVQTVIALLDEVITQSSHADAVLAIRQELAAIREPLFKDAMVSVSKALLALKDEDPAIRAKLVGWKNAQEPLIHDRYDSHLYSESNESALKVPEVKAVFTESSPVIQGFEVLNACFDAMLARDPRIIAFGEDLGLLGDVNQGFMGMQAKYGALRVSDTGIRECTILGQAIGMALRGLRPIAEVQYLDYLLYALQIMSDDLATLQYRTKGGQKSPVIVRTRGHRLEGIWHSGSPMAGIINLVRGMHVLVPRDMTQAAGFYNTLLRSDEPGLIVEVLNGYRLKERKPDNIGEFTVPLGVPEVIRQGNDVTIVTYGACCRVATEAAETLATVGIETEIVDVQSLLPFDLHGVIGESLKKTNRILFLDEDVPGGTSAYMMQEVLEKQNGYNWLDSAPRTLSAKAHRPAYGTDGNYWSKPNAEQIFETVYEIMNETDPQKYPMFFK
ncbi:MAG TPA: thiamine pyrophosphate-dependent enzyme [Candidatus Kapabacteria bacterium]|nr:thiamine pyrophosphate-dependent enzyme [Candidatus Kapabacteria bacterium]